MKTSIRLSSVLFAAGVFEACFCAMADPASASSTYVYDASVNNWYSATDDRPAFTKYTFTPDGTTSPFRVEAHTSLLYVNVPNAVGANANLVGAHAGATWTAPAEEQISSITLSYGSVLTPGLNLSVWGASGTGAFTTELGRISPAGTVDNRGSSTSIIFTVPDGTSITSLQIRGLELVAASALGQGWYDQIRGVTIETVPLSNIPEPSTCTLLTGLCSLGVICAFRRRR